MMLPSREVIQLENQRFYVSNNVSTSRQLNSKQQSSELVINNISQSSNIMQGIGSHMPVTNTTSGQCATQNNTSVYNGFYSSSTFNSINNFEASLQWLTESRIPNNGLLDKNINCSSHTPSHSCCVNRLTGVENLGMCSPLPGDSFRSGRETVNFQTKPPALSVNMMDSVQNWFNLPTLPNQQYGSKFNDSSMNCSQMSLPIIDQSDLKQNEVCLQITDSYFESPLNNSNNTKQLNSNSINDINNKIPDINEASPAKGYNSTYQPNVISREGWKPPPPLQTAASYVSSPTLFNSLNDSPEHYLYSLPPAVTSASSYCMITDNVTTNINSKNISSSSCSGLQHNHLDKQVVNSRLSSCAQLHNNQIKVGEQAQIDSTYLTNAINNRSDKTMPYIDHRKVSLNSSNTSHILNSCNIKNCENIARKFGNGNNGQYSTVFMTAEGNSNVVHNEGGSVVNEKNVNDRQVNENENNIVEITDETTSGSEESNIIVEESDELEETESVISIDEMKKGYISEEPVELRCLVCNVKSSTQTPATNFIHMNDSFPLTTASKTPVAVKLIEILPTDLQHFLKLHNSFMCRRCLNLIETVEVLEVKLTSVKQTLSENFSKTVQYFLPATPIVEIENGTAKIIDKEIIVCIDNSNKVDLAFSQNVEPTRKLQEETSNVDTTKEVPEGSEGEFDQEEEEEEVEECVSSEENESVCEENSSKENEELKELEGVQCKVCMKVLSSVKKCKWHMQLHTKRFSYYCEFCGKGFNLKHSLEKHVMSHDVENRFQCEICGKTYTQKHRLNVHLKRHLGEFKMFCKECGKGFMEKASMEEHMLTHTKEQKCICEICGSKFGRQSNLKAHQEICKKEEIKCDLCTQVFYSKTQLKKHKVMSHGLKPSVECNICSKVFVNAKDLKPHMRSHSDEKPHMCKLCGKRYKSVSNLNYHAKLHDASKMLKCSFCDELFCSLKLLNAHTNKHTHERLFKCDQCGKEFFKLTNYQFHMKIHSGTVKMKACHVCGKTFRKGLEAHIRTHTGVRPYVCHLCGTAFTVSSALTRHVQAKHKNAFES